MGRGGCCWTRLMISSCPWCSEEQLSQAARNTKMKHVWNPTLNWPSPINGRDGAQTYHDPVVGGGGLLWPGALCAGGVPLPGEHPNHGAACPLHPACWRGPKGTTLGTWHVSAAAPEPKLQRWFCWRSSCNRSTPEGVQCLREALADF